MRRKLALDRLDGLKTLVVELVQLTGLRVPLGDAWITLVRPERRMHMLSPAIDEQLSKLNLP